MEKIKSSTIYCVIDDYGWVQEDRIKYIEPYLLNFNLAILSAKEFSVLWNNNKLREEYVYFCSWRTLVFLENVKVCLFLEADFKYFMTSVTSHYNIGGGLKPERAVRKGEDVSSAFNFAVNKLKLFQVVTVNSSILRDLLLDSLPNLMYVPNGVDTEKFSPRLQNTYCTNRPVVGWTGKIKGAKNIELLDAATPLLEEMGYLVCRMDVSKNKSLLSRVFNKLLKKRIGNYFSKNKMPKFYHRIDFYLNTSYHEGTPNPALESAASGIPVVTTKVGNMTDLIHDGENGFFIEPNLESLIHTFEKIKGMPAKEYRRMSENIRSDIAKHWTWKVASERYRTAFQLFLKRQQ